MPTSRLLPLALLALGICLPSACGDRSTRETAERATSGAADVPPRSGLPADDDTSRGRGDQDLYLTGVTEAELDDLLDRFGSADLDRDNVDWNVDWGVELDGPAAAVPDAGTHFPIEGPRGGALFSLGPNAASSSSRTTSTGARRRSTSTTPR